MNLQGSFKIFYESNQHNKDGNRRKAWLKSMWAIIIMLMGSSITQVQKKLKLKSTLNNYKLCLAMAICFYRQCLDLKIRFAANLKSIFTRIDLLAKHHWSKMQVLLMLLKKLGNSNRHILSWNFQQVIITRTYVSAVMGVGRNFSRGWGTGFFQVLTKSFFPEGGKYSEISSKLTKIFF